VSGFFSDRGPVIPQGTRHRQTNLLKRAVLCSDKDESGNRQNAKLSIGGVQAPQQFLHSQIIGRVIREQEPRR
jgi:hypothetical protein